MIMSRSADMSEPESGLGVTHQHTMVVLDPRHKTL